MLFQNSNSDKRNQCFIRPTISTKINFSNSRSQKFHLLNLFSLSKTSPNYNMLKILNPFRVKKAFSTFFSQEPSFSNLKKVTKSEQARSSQTQWNTYLKSVVRPSRQDLEKRQDFHHGGRKTLVLHDTKTQKEINCCCPVCRMVDELRS